MKLIYLLIAMCLCSGMFSCASTLTSNADAVTASLPDEAHQFDFWLGDWDLAWANGSGTNSVTRIFAGTVILEDFHDPNTGYAGGSISEWRPTEQKWRQVWMDSQGSFLSFLGGWDGEQMSLTLTNPEDTGQPDRITRLRWHDIESEAFIWTYEGSDDEGETWATLWEINYSRRR